MRVSEQFSKKLELATNSAVLLVAILAGWVFARDLFLQKHLANEAGPGGPNISEPLKGQRVALPGVTWNANQPTLVMALATYCHFCAESAPFYHQLTELSRTHSVPVRIVTVFSQDSQQAQQFVTKYGIHPDQVVSTPIDTLGVSGTPTLLLVRGDGTVEREWIGKLSQVEENKIVELLKAQSSSTPETRAGL